MIIKARQSFDANKRFFAKGQILSADDLAHIENVKETLWRNGCLEGLEEQKPLHIPDIPEPGAGLPDVEEESAEDKPKKKKKKQDAENE